MSSTRHLAQLLVCCFAFTLPAAAQLDSAALRAKFGTPLNRETFHMPEGFDLVVDYGTNNQVCKLRTPALMPTTESVFNSSAMRQRMFDFLAALVPDSMRGKEIRRMASIAGMVSISSIEYEYVTISDVEHGGDPFSSDNIITVTFKSNSCQGPSGH